MTDDASRKRTRKRLVAIAKRRWDTRHTYITGFVETASACLLHASEECGFRVLLARFWIPIRCESRSSPKNYFHRWSSIFQLPLSLRRNPNRNPNRMILFFFFFQREFRPFSRNRYTNTKEISVCKDVLHLLLHLKKIWSSFDQSSSKIAFTCPRREIKPRGNDFSLTKMLDFSLCESNFLEIIPSSLIYFLSTMERVAIFSLLKKVCNFFFRLFSFLLNNFLIIYFLFFFVCVLNILKSSLSRDGFFFLGFWDNFKSAISLLTKKNKSRVWFFVKHTDFQDSWYVCALEISEVFARNENIQKWRSASLWRFFRRIVEFYSQSFTSDPQLDDNCRDNIGVD